MDRTVLGTRGAPPLGAIGADGVVVLAGERGTVRWWVVAEDRTHIIEREASVRHRRVDHAPVVEIAVKVPGGDVVGRSYGVVAGDDGAALAVEVANRTAVPVAVVFVLGPGAMSVNDGGLLVDGRPSLHSTRRPARVLAADDLDELAARVGVHDEGAAPTSGTWGAVVVPLPHSQAVSVVVDALDPDSTPSAEQVASGWSQQVERGTRLELGEDRRAESWARDRRDLLVGRLDRVSPDMAAARLPAFLRLGWWAEASEATEVVLGAQRANGQVGSEQPGATTIVALEGLAGWVRAGVPADALEQLAEPVARAARWLSRRGWRVVDAEERPRARRAVRNAWPLMALLGQSEAAEALRKVEGCDVEDDPVAGLGGQGTDPASRLVALIDSVATETEDGIELFGRFDEADAGRPLEAFDLPTRWGLFSVALRWHGSRPAILWEIDPWGDPRPFDVPVLRAPRLDASWTAHDRRGDALLRV
jgi:hypothetical protein